MTDTLFTSFQFPSSVAIGATALRTLSDRLAEIKNVRDFGAVGDGVTDDWAAIMAAFNWTVNVIRGTIYFPPGTYYVSAPVDTSGTNIGCLLKGCHGISIIVGNFADYIISRGAGGNSGDNNGHMIEGLTIINNHPNGGGIRMGPVVGAAIRDCVITANQGIITAWQDSSPSPDGALEVTIENCVLSPGSNPTGSQGLMLVADGPIINCRIVGYDIGALMWGGEGAQAFMGCHFELCKTGFKPGYLPTGAVASAGGIYVAGSTFKNCGTAVNLFRASVCLRGVNITAAAGTIAGDPQYGIITGGSSSFFGVRVTGEYAVAGISVGAADVGGFAPTEKVFMGVQSINSAVGKPNWEFPSRISNDLYFGCNVQPVPTLSQVPIMNLTVTSATWSAGTATLTFSSAPTSLYTSNFKISVSGVTPSGFNGSFSGVGSDTFAISYPLASDPGGSGSTGLVTAVLVGNGVDAISEGDCYNISDSSTATWGNPVVTGSGSNHIKARYTTQGLTVVGK